MSMGCGCSKYSLKSNLKRRKAFKKIEDSFITTNFTQSYDHLDIQISKLESLCPGPRLAVLEAWIENLQEEIGGDEHVEEASINLRTSLEKSEPQDIVKLAAQLGIVVDSEKATQHENFFAKLCETSKELLLKRIVTEIIQSAKTRAKYLLQQYNLLISLYSKQDSLIAKEAIYYTELEETLDLQLEEARNIRDKLGSAMEQWRTCAFLLVASVKSSYRAADFWEQIKTKKSSLECINLALECRTASMASLISLECAQLSLPNVELQHVSDRQLSAVRHISKYMLTDISQQDRFQQTSETLEHFQKNVSETITWFRKTYETTLKPDYDEADRNVNTIAKTLREHRIKVHSNPKSK